MTSRRSVLAKGAALGGVILLSGCGSTQTSRKTKDAELGEPVGGTYSRPRTESVTANRPHWSQRVQPSAPTASVPQGVIPRTTWTNQGPKTYLADPMGQINRITVHHDGMSAFYATDQASAMRRIENIRRAHLGNGWADIGYHYVIDPSGRVYEARPINLQGAHVKDNNPGNLGVMVLGNFEKQRPSPAAQQSLDNFLADRMTYYNVRVTRLYTHKELRPTACPGRALQNHMDETRGRGGRLAMV